MELVRNDRRYRLSCEAEALDFDAVHAILVRAYWCEGIPRATLAKAIAHSLCANLHCEGVQIGIARWVTDRATFAYLCDVFVHEDHRGLGLGEALVGFGLQHPDLQGLRRQTLFTRDMHALYARFGFTPLAAPERGMELLRVNPYQSQP